MPQTILPTSLVGSYAQPDWLIDREKLARRFPPRVRARSCGASRRNGSKQAQDDATLLAIRDQERAGLDIITDGEMRRESYSNRFATALEGVDIDNPGTALDRSGHPNPVPRVVGQDPPQASGRGARRAVPARQYRSQIKMTVPGPFTMAQQAQNDFYDDEEELALDYAAAVNEEIKDLFAAGADIVQIDEPYMQARPEKARAVRARRAQPRARRRHAAQPPCISASAMRRSFMSGRRAIRFCRSWRIAPVQPDFDRDRAVLSRLLGAGDASGQDDHSRRARSVDMTIETPEIVAARIRRALQYAPAEQSWWRRTAG